MAVSAAQPKGLDQAAKQLWGESVKDLRGRGEWSAASRDKLERYIQATATARRARRDAGGDLTILGSHGQLTKHPLVRIAEKSEDTADRLARELGLGGRQPRKADEAEYEPGPIMKRLPRLRWRFQDFEWFCAQLELPTGGQFLLEPHLRLILKFVFRTGMSELLVLLPKGNGKTALFAALAIFHMLITRNAQCFILAADEDQAGEMYRFAQYFIEGDGQEDTRTPANRDLEELLAIRESTFRIRSRRDRGFIRVMRSDKTKQGGRRHSYNPTLALIDELHAHENDNAYTALRTAAFKRGGLVLNCSTAGHDKDTTLGRLRQGMLDFDQCGGRVRPGLKFGKSGRLVRAHDGRLTVCESKSRRTAMLEWACRDDDDLSDAEAVKLANPASWVTVESIEDALEAPGITPWSFARYRANVWTLGFEAWIPEQAWPGLAVVKRFDESPYEWITERRRVCIDAPPRLGIQQGDGIFCAVDMARYRDAAAITCIAPRDNEPPAAWLAFVERSGGVDHPVDYGPVKDALRDLDDAYRLLAAGWDPKYFDEAAAELEGEGLPMVKFEQSNARMCPASANLREAILKAGLRHDGDPVFAAHVMAGVTKDVGPDEWRLIKSQKTGPPIDALIALAMAHQLAFFREKQPVPFVEVIR